ncbi:hypothetical protein [Microbacterium sp. NIBRBAC000506063]|uniref:hypothetical protein n=1 Tax=Microbacterium sp. NIBRBAC000506063 TaxID=2734618 RepID=UPI001BB6CFDD|nr:hypothetical protein [Microbacterium sp. NIBRBAC000506063]QTV80035.1 hypothetical protein KAE78_02585 [Microbacterium sp. NIBRBAC000506063]
MIEVQDSDVADTAVDTGMSPQVLGDQLQVYLALSQRAFTDHLHMALAIASVVAARRLAIALTTGLLQPVRP